MHILGKEETLGRTTLVNPANREPEHAHGLEGAESATVVDCTLREGEQTPGVIFPRREKLRLAESLVAAGAREIECGMPAISQYEAETVREIVQLGLGCRTTVLAMATRDDVLRARDCGVDGIGLSLPAGRLQLEKKLRWSEDRVIETAVELSTLAKAEGLRVNLSPYDTSRADPAFLERYITTVYKDGHIDGVRVVDTVGAAGPGLIAGLVRKLIDWTGGSVDVEVHCHDDFGLAVANTLAGIGAGARVASTTLNGLGERAGNAPTQQVVAALELLYGIDTGFDLPTLTALGRHVERMAGRSLPDDEPLTGSMTFALEAGAIVSGYMADPLVAFPFPPETVGARARVLLGKQSGKHSLDYKAAELGFGTLDDGERSRLLERIKTEAQETGQMISDKRFKEWLEEAGVETTR